MKRLIFALAISLVFNFSFGQSRAFDATDDGSIIRHYDSIYPGAFHKDSTKSVFHTDEEFEKMNTEYTTLLQSLGKFLKANNYKWTKETKMWQRFYFSPEGKTDYVVYIFRGKAEEQPTTEQKMEFNRLLNLFIQDYQFGMTAKSKFSQCSPSVYYATTETTK
ncbi:MAG TPA: hypothetical protein VGB95_00525 [Chitinophagales bacterium]